MKASEHGRGSEPVTSDSDVSSAVLSPPLASSRRKPGPKPGQKRGRARRLSGKGRGRENDESAVVENEEEKEHGGKKGRVEELEEVDDEEEKENPKTTRRGRRSRPRPPSPPTPSLPPKKFFKNREETASPPASAIVSSSLNLRREVASPKLLSTLPNSSKITPPSSKAVPPSPTPSSESRDFKQWLETKLSPSLLLSSVKCSFSYRSNSSVQCSLSNRRSNRTSSWHHQISRAHPTYSRASSAQLWPTALPSSDPLALAPLPYSQPPISTSDQRHPARWH